jgi:2',3'-cyclic-nucleotide 2'-phosphodiesterase (5'-nucleotidase family)
MVVDAPVSFTVIADSLPEDAEVEAALAPFRARMGEEIKEVIGETADVLSKASPEGTLGNFATDAMLWAANEYGSEPVQMALTNNGGLRVPIGPGPITVGQMYELMPFENLLSVLTLSGAQLLTLCQQIAEDGGEPVAGFSFRIGRDGERRVAENILVAGQPLDLEGRYRLVTNDFLANGGGDMTPLHSPLARQDLPVLLRDAFIEYVKHVGVVYPEIEGRITGGIGR